MLVLALILLVLFGLAIGVALGVAVKTGARKFRERVARDIAQLFADAGPAVGPEDLHARRAALPEPIQRYLGFAISEAAPALCTVRLKHGGFLRPKPNGPWLKIQGEEYFAVSRPGFVWHGQAETAEILWVDARDSLLGERGNMLVKFCSAFNVADAHGPEIDQGASLRWLAEAMWFPFALVGARIHWEPVDHRSARATLVQDGLPVAALFEVDAEGKLIRVSGERYYDAGQGKPVLRPWFGRCAEWRDFGGFCVPTSVEVSWILPEGEFCYVRFNVTVLEFNKGEAF